ncbi:uncharacterized protein [Setaria viridis]|uniref:F-box/LRR-repeat protein 15/At3g58940/PEG3-like LRR domain-containing protein n=1 Tax=Setaria viridis TaxID=4556 RepID=A0A4U6U141_SETVI|nr:uncharacterized protein LOC117865894 isoform X2 [Setaria viridis]TKW07754.1 hypothetical protein SEVIR_7G328300v2 [Setaria viridis]
MPGLILDLDPEATARPLARSASSTAPAASKQPPPRAPRSAGWQPTIDEDPGELAAANRASPSPCAAPAPRALARPTPTASTLHRVTGGAPLPPPTTPRSDGRQLPHQEVTEDATKQAAPSPCPAPSSRLPFGFACPRQYATTPTYYAPVAPALLYASRASLLFPRPYVPASMLPTMPGMQPQQQTRAAAKAVLAQTQRQLPCTKEGDRAAVGHKKGEVLLHNSKERPPRIRDRHAQNPRKPMAGWHISNPTEHDITESLAAFSTTKSDELDVIRDVLMVLPKAPRSILDNNHQNLGGGDPGGDGTNTSTLIHTQRGSTGSIASEVTTHDISIELARFGFIRSFQLKTIWEKDPLILYDAAIVCAAKAIRVKVDMMKMITSILQNHPGPVKYFRIDSSQIENGRDQLEEWFNLLRKKEVEEVVIVNCSWPHQMIDFPINELDCESLTRIRLCFFRISGTVLKYCENLSAIDLSCCTISSQDLYALVDQAKNLKELDIGHFEGDAIRISSDSLEILIIWSCTVQSVSVQNAMKLRKILVAARPKKTSCYVKVFICDAHELTDVWLNVSTQSVTMNNISMIMDIAPLQSLRRLVLNISLLVQKERLTLLNLMKSCTRLKELTLWRNDTPLDDEVVDAIADDWPVELKDLSCLKLHLEVFNIKNFKDLQKTVQASVNAVVNYITGRSDCGNFFFEEV